MLGVVRNLQPRVEVVAGPIEFGLVHQHRERVASAICRSTKIEKWSPRPTLVFLLITRSA